MEINLRLDSDGRTTFDPELSAEFLSVPFDSGKNRRINYESSAIVLNSLVSAAQEGDRMFDTGKEIEKDEFHGRNRYDELLLDCEVADCALLPRTFWISPDDTPRCAMEQLAQQIFRYHVRSDYCYDKRTSGAEWWVQIRPSPPAGRYSMMTERNEADNSSISFHWDKDEELRLLTGGNMFIYPHISTVTYLTNHGSPTMVLPCVNDCTSGTPEFRLQHTQKAYVSWPRVGKHFSFDGRLLHAAPSNLVDPEVLRNNLETIRQLSVSSSSVHKTILRRNRRITFLVNIWLNHKPLGIESFPESTVDKLSKMDSREKEFLRDVHQSPTIEVVVDTENGAGKSSGNNIVFIWPLGACDSEDESVNMTLPLHKIHSEMKNGGNIVLSWASSDEGITHRFAEKVVGKTQSPSGNAEGLDAKRQQSL